MCEHRERPRGEAGRSLTCSNPQTPTAVQPSRLLGHLRSGVHSARHASTDLAAAAPLTLLTASYDGAVSPPHCPPPRRRGSKGMPCPRATSISQKKPRKLKI